MPRVANPPRPGRGADSSLVRRHSSLRMALNDDAQEKAVRLQSRQALHDLQLNQIKAAATPMRKLVRYDCAASTSLHSTPDKQFRERREDGDLLAGMPNSASPMRRVPILANFEEWMKMATDNKINATNSWNFALIDYFHDMSLLKEGDGVNFQKASCTLDGCVKIYTSRVDSVATETGKLLSGLADSDSKKQRRQDGDADAEADDDEGEEGDEADGAKKRAKKRTTRSSEATLAPSFASLQLKKFELEFSVDPLFKKASADFDEGGAKGLLLNHLSIDTRGRIVFDSSDDLEPTSVTEPSPEEQKSDGAAAETELDSSEPAVEVDLSALGARFFPDLDVLEVLDICPSLKNLDFGDPASALDIPFLKAQDHDGSATKPDARGGQTTSAFGDENDAPGLMDDDEDAMVGGFDVVEDAGFGEGGEAWARDAALEPQMRVYAGNPGAGIDTATNEDDAGGEMGDFGAGGPFYGISLQHGKNEGTHEDILSYFDNTLKKNWAGPEHWKIHRVRDSARSAAAPVAKRKEKEPFLVDFLAPMDPSLTEMLYTPASSNSAISLPKTQWKSRTRNLLPDDKHFNSRQLLRLFLKPKARMGSRKARRTSGARIVKQEPAAGEEMDEAFWARQGPLASEDQDDVVAKGDYDADFFQDDGMAFPGGLMSDDDEEEFADARERFSPGLDEVDHGIGPGIGGAIAAHALEGAFGSQLVTHSKRLRPEYVQYARVAKKVDVRRLKEEMWKGIGFEENPPVSSKSSTAPDDAGPLAETTEPLRFTSVMNGLQAVYPRQAMADISTSYCFICLLHLANEKGLTLANDEGLEELSIRKDPTAEITMGGA